MEEKNKNSQVLKISVFVASIFLILISVSYAFITQTFAGTKKQVITAGVLDLLLDEKNEITISDALPMSDNVGMMQEEVYEFDLINNTTTDTEYTIKLNKVNTSDLSENIVKYGLIKDGQQKIAFLSTLNDGVIDSGTISGSDTIEYELRLWIDSNVSDENSISGKTLSYTLSVEVGQVPEKVVLFEVTENEIVSSNKVLTLKNTNYNYHRVRNTAFTDEEVASFTGATSEVTFADGSKKVAENMNIINYQENSSNPYVAIMDNMYILSVKAGNTITPDTDGNPFPEGVYVMVREASPTVSIKIYK